MHTRLLRRRSFGDLSLRSKLILSIILCIILPIFIVAMIVGQDLSKESTDNAYENQLSLMEKSIDNIDQIYEQVWDLKTIFQVNYDIQKIVKGSATAKDFYLAGTKIQDLTRTVDYIHAITISTKEGIVFQHDKFLLYEKSEYFDRAVDSGANGFWTEPYTLDNAFFEKDQKTRVLSFFYLINQVQNLDKTLTVLGISIKEESLSTLLLSQYESRGAKNLLIRVDGLVLSAHDKDLINTSMKDTIDMFEGEMGVVDGEDGSVIFYRKGGASDAYLVSIIPGKIFSAGQSALYFTIGLAILLSTLFAIVFSLIQNHYIIRPLGELLGDMEKVKGGDFTIEEKHHGRDEIGAITEGFDEMKLTLRQTIDEVYLSRIHEQEARYTALLSQLNPHFLYNTLDSIHWLAIRNRDYAVGEQIETLSDVFRHVLSEGRNYVTIDEELTFVTDYMRLLKARNGDRIRVDISIEEGLGTHLIPKLIIQPLVENSIQHGLEPKIDGGTISIVISPEGDHILIIVEDDGVGADEREVTEKMNSGDELTSAFALRNIHKRLKLSYGEAYGIEITSEPDKGFQIRMRIPMTEGEQPCD
ncbi:MAG: sensor histidine kinase [Spirochaetia bacterium]|nr:sensor histidine kinase [Spirochaetia bacterium]